MRSSGDGMEEPMTRIQILTAILITAGCTTGGFPDDGGQSGEETITCGAVDSLELADDEASALGFGRAEVAALTEGTHAGTLSYQAGGSSDLTLAVTLGSARWLDMEWVDSGTGELAEPATDMGCADLVEVDATIAFQTADGAFDETWDTALDAPMASEADFWMDLDLAALGGSFTYTPDDDYDAVTTYVQGSFDDSGAHGAIEGQGEQSEGSGDDGTVSATNLELASW